MIYSAKKRKAYDVHVYVPGPLFEGSIGHLELTERGFVLEFDSNGWPWWYDSSRDQSFSIQAADRVVLVDGDQYIIPAGVCDLMFESDSWQ